MAQRVLGAMGRYVLDNSPISPGGLSGTGCSMLQMMSRLKFGPLVALTTLVCTSFGDAEIGGGVAHVQSLGASKAYDVFDYIDPLIGTNSGGMLEATALISHS